MLHTYCHSTCNVQLVLRLMCVDWLYRIVLKSNCDTPIDVWLVSGHHQHQQKEDDEVAFGNSQAAMPAPQVKHAPDGLAGKTFGRHHAKCNGMTH